MAISLYMVAKWFMLPTGVWKLSISPNPSTQTIYSIYSVIIQSLYIMYNASMLIRLIQMWGKYPMAELYVFLTLTILILEINYKIMIYLKNGIPQMFATVVEREESVLNSEDGEMKTIYLSKVKYYKFATFCQCFCSGFGISWFVIINIYTKYCMRVKVDHFMYELWFPFDKEKHDTFVAVYNVVMAFYGFLFNCASQTPLQTLMVFAAAQLEILQLKFSRSFEEKVSSEEAKLEHVKKLIQEHQFLIQFVTNLNEAIKYTILLEFSVESVHGAAALLQLISTKKAIEIPYAMIYLSLLVINMSTLAWSANEVTTQSEKVADGAYGSNWTPQSEPLKKLLLMVLMRAQKPLSIDVGPFRPMNNEAALMTAKGSYTYAQFMIHSRSISK